MGIRRVETRNRNRPVVLGLADAAMIHRWLEFVMDGRRFDNPIVAFEVKRDATAAKERLGQKLCDIFERKSAPETPE